MEDPIPASPPSFEGSTTPPPLTGYPPAFNRMVSIGNMPLLTPSQDFDIVETYHRLLHDDPDLTMPVAAIEALIELLVQSRASTVFETLDLVKSQSLYLKSRIPNSISLSAGTDLFQRYMISSLKPSSGPGGRGGRDGNFESVRQHLLSNGRLFVTRAKAARERIASYGAHFVRDGSVVLTHGGSRVVGALLSKAASVSKSQGNIRFKVIYVLNSTRASESRATVSSLRAKGVPVATISEGAVGYAMGKVDLVIVGAEGVVENGGIISRLGTYQIALLAKAAGKPFYVAAESHKFVRLYPLGQYDLGIDQEIVKFETEEEGEEAKGLGLDLGDEEREEGFADKTPRVEERDEYFGNVGAVGGDDGSGIVGGSKVGVEMPKSSGAGEAVDFTPPALVSALITETGVMTSSSVSEELISMWY